MANSRPEVWLRGPVPGIPATLQPVAHALLQAGEEVEAILLDFPDPKLWERPAGVASVGFHLQHLSGVLNRLFTYARGESLDPAQLDALRTEEKPRHDHVTSRDLIDAFHREVERTVEELRRTDEGTLHEPRTVGRSQLPSTVFGLMVHAAEHTQRHVGQLLVTARIVQSTTLPSTVP
jgi:uncharacterized damage-inducible protein DinB